jgi:NAD(P)-dependent dehydrogenase (short-subunit alcohol dehydrogenase family)
MYKKKTVFISASSSGIGFHLAEKYKAFGYNVIINGTNRLKLKKASSILNCDYFLGDLANIKKIKLLIKKLKKKYKYIDILICNLGNSKFNKNNTDYYHAFKYNFFSTTSLVESSKSILKKSQSKIICISSICGTESIQGAPIGYSIAKSALNFYIKLISKELAKDKISINGIVPGNIFFKGSTWDLKIQKDSKKTKNYIKQNVPLNKFGSIDDIFQVCKILSQNKSGYITGSLFKLDGGQTKSF